MFKTSAERGASTNSKIKLERFNANDKVTNSISSHYSTIQTQIQTSDKNYYKNLNSAYEQTIIENESLNNKYLASKREIQILQKQVTDLKQQLSEYQQRENEITTKYDNLSRKYREMKESFKNNEDKYIKKHNEILSEVQNHQSSMVNDILRESENKTQVINCKTKEINENRIMINRLKNLVELQEKQIKNLKEDLSRSDEKYQQLKNKLQLEKQRHDEYAKSTSVALSESTQATLNYESLIENLRNENNLLSMSNTQLKSSIDKLKLRLNSRKEKIFQIKTALKNIAEENEELQNSAVRESSQVNELHKTIIRYQQAIANVPNRVDIFLSTIEKLFSEIITKVDSKCTEIYCSVKTYKEEAAKSKQRVLELAKQLGDVTKMFQNSTAIQSNLEAQRSQIAAEVENAASAICCLAGEDFPADNDIHKRLQKAVSAAEKLANESSHSRINSSAIDNYAEFKDNFNEERKRLYAGISELRSALKITKESLIQSERENSVLRKESALSTPRKEVYFDIADN